MMAGTTMEADFTDRKDNSNDRGGGGKDGKDSGSGR
jgi:hypothetical protein